MPKRPVTAIFLLTMAICLCNTAAVIAEDRVDFTREVKPLLSNKCFACHGPDADDREADLRLDTFEGATSDLGGYAAVSVGDVKASELVARILESDPDLRMPPAEFGDALTADEVDILKRWIAGGADYEAHWAYVKPERPETTNERTAIDELVRARLPEIGLSPSPQATPYLLARRVALDLTGLPPTLSKPINSQPIQPTRRMQR